VEEGCVFRGEKREGGGGGTLRSLHVGRKGNKIYWYVGSRVSPARSSGKGRL